MMSQRARTALLVALAIGFAVTVPTRMQSALAANAARNQDDFQTFYRTARCLFLDPCDPYQRVAGINPNLAPPHAHALLMPVLLVPQFPSYLAWMAISVMALGVTTLRYARVAPAGLTALPATVLGAAAAGSGLMMALVSSGQIYAVLTWPVTEAWLALRRNQTTRAAVLIGLAASIKPILLLPIPWLLLNGNPRAALVAAATFSLVFAGGIWCLGASPYEGWLNTLANLPTDGHFRDGSLLETLIRGFMPTEYLSQVTNAPEVVRPLWAVLSAVIVSVTMIKRVGPDRTWLALLSAACLVAPKGWIYAGWWFLFPAIAVWESGSRWTRGLLTAAGALLWLPDTAPMWGQPNPALTLAWGSLYFWTWLIIWVASEFAPTRPPVTTT